MNEKLIKAFGEHFLYIIDQWPQLTTDDIREIYEGEYKKVHAVYDNWEDIAMEHLERGDCDKYIRPFVDIKALAKHISITEKNDWIELKSGKLINAE